MVNKQTGTDGPPDMDDPLERPTAPPTSRVAPNEAGRKKDWVRLLERAARASDGAGSAGEGEPPGIPPEARRLAKQVGELALQSFSLLSAADRSEIIAAVTERFFGASAALVSLVDT